MSESRAKNIISPCKFEIEINGLMSFSEPKPQTDSKKREDINEVDLNMRSDLSMKNNMTSEKVSY